MKEVEDLFVNYAFKHFADCAEERDRSIVTDIVRVFLFKNCTDMSKFPLSRNFGKTKRLIKKITERKGKFV